MPLNEQTLLYVFIAFLFGLLLKPFITAYITKKAENLATKEDIELITDKIESVRASIEIGKDAHKAFVTERKEALVKFYDEITTFFYELMAVNFGDLPMDEGQSLYKYQKDFYKSVANILKAYQRLVIYLPKDSWLLNQALIITNNVVEARKILKDNFGAIKITGLREQQAYANYDGQDRQEYEDAVKAADIANEKYWHLMKPLAESLRRNFQAYSTELNSNLQEDEING